MTGFVSILAFVLLFGEEVSAQSTAAFLDPTAASLFRSAQGNWMAID